MFVWSDKKNNHDLKNDFSKIYISKDKLVYLEELQIMLSIRYYEYMGTHQLGTDTFRANYLIIMYL